MAKGKSKKATKGTKVPYPGAKGKSNPFAGAMNAAMKQKKMPKMK